jgi:hypothetical protein
MAVKNDASRYVVRLLAVTALFVAVAGAVVWGVFAGVDDVIARMGRLMFFLGLVFPVLWAAVEIGAFTKALATSRGAVGGNAVLQILIAGAILVAVNFFAAGHYVRFDWTRDHAFTLPPRVAEQMAQLRGDTDIYVVVKHVSFGQRSGEARDAYDLAAEKKIVEKVKDLAYLFQDAGPRFHVRTLDVEDEDFPNRVLEIRNREKQEAESRNEPETSPLADAIKAAPENSIFFRTGGKVARLAFHDIYAVDKEKSMNSDNLVLTFQGIEPLARKIFNIEEKKPRVTLAVVHPALSMTSRDHPLLTMNGAKKALEAQGFVCNDILLRKQDPEGGLSQEAAALSFDESRFEQIEDEVADLDDAIRVADSELPAVRKSLDFWKGTLADIGKKYIYIRLANGQQGLTTRDKLKQLEDRKVPFDTMPVDDQDRIGQQNGLNRAIAIYEQQIEEARKEKSALETEQRGLNVDELAERKRIADVEAKMKQLLSDTDLLVLPRFTFHHLPSEQIISNKVHKLDDAQLRAIKAFLKSGKPALFLLGPSNEKRDVPPEPGGGDDRLEPMLAELGISLPKQTILYNAEMKEFNERKAGLGFSMRELNLPPASVDWPIAAGEVGKYAGPTAPNPIRESLLITGRSLWVPHDSDAALSTRDNLKQTLPADARDAGLAAYLKSINDEIVKRIDEKLRKLADKPQADKTDDDKSAEKKLREERSRIQIVFHVDWDSGVPADTKVTLNLGDASVKQVLDRIADAEGLGWFVESGGDKDGQVVIRKNREGRERGYKLGLGETLSDLQIRAPRPVYPLLSKEFGEAKAALFDESDVFLMTDDATWNENFPFVNEKREVPRFQPTKEGDPKKGTLEEERHGPFPIAAAVERKIPVSWYGDKNTTPARIRLGVLGNGGVFVGQSISPIKEKLLFDVSNWLLGRDDLLARSAGTWSYPRTDLSMRAEELWFLAVQFGLPMLFAYLGVLVWLVRRAR